VVRTPARWLRTVVAWQLAEWGLRLATVWFMLDAFRIEQSARNVLLGRRRKASPRSYRSAPVESGPPMQRPELAIGDRIPFGPVCRRAGRWASECEPKALAHPPRAPGAARRARGSLASLGASAARAALPLRQQFRKARRAAPSAPRTSRPAAAWRDLRLRVAGPVEEVQRQADPTRCCECSRRRAFRRSTAGRHASHSSVSAAT
jgi:hypothetical protein